ncbi:hypothetical protein [Pedobacter xixiisoli]|uniref:hypothetical protein n=1 Tax=Pedobacter xixiisoli TaxID=1476464 RepID=UPI001F0D4004|nr:hypothetical protein [Pedobacter xixiisoli]
MAFYDLPKDERNQLVADINRIILEELTNGKTTLLLSYFSDEDTYIRKTTYIAIGKIFQSNQNLLAAIISLIEKLWKHDDFTV